MRFSDAVRIEEVTWTMRAADLPRGENRARINDLANGAAPFSDQAVKENNIATNVKLFGMSSASSGWSQTILKRPNEARELFLRKPRFRSRPQAHGVEPYYHQRNQSADEAGVSAFT